MVQGEGQTARREINGFVSPLDIKANLIVRLAPVGHEVDGHPSEIADQRVSFCVHCGGRSFPLFREANSARENTGIGWRLMAPAETSGEGDS